jgi:hypothetical protein
VTKRLPDRQCSAVCHDLLPNDFASNNRATAKRSRGAGSLTEVRWDEFYMPFLAQRRMKTS